MKGVKTVRYTICFDFPDSDEPLFAGWTGSGTLGLAPSLRTAAMWGSEKHAENALANAYGPETRKFGVVVEVPEQPERTPEKASPFREPELEEIP